MDKIKRIIVVDDHEFYRTGLVKLLRRLKNVKVIGEASTGKEFLEKMKNDRADIVFMDIKMPEMDGIAATKLSREFYPYTEIIALTMYSEKEYFLQMMYAGAKGFLLKDCASQEFEKAINAVSDGNNYYPKGLASDILFNKNQNHN